MARKASETVSLTMSNDQKVQIGLVLIAPFEDETVWSRAALIAIITSGKPWRSQAFDAIRERYDEYLAAMKAEAPFKAFLELSMANAKTAKDKLMLEESVKMYRQQNPEPIFWTNYTFGPDGIEAVLPESEDE